MKTEQELWEKEFGLDLPTEEEMEEMSKYYTFVSLRTIQIWK